ncbi:MAG: nodulation protein NfeD [Nitrospirae bacterium]|nr:nodulation protein NfeD [Nitrospirota bacterium]
MKAGKLHINLRIIISCIIFLLGVYSLAPSAQKRIYVAKYDGVINPVAGEYIVEVINDANKKDVTAVLIELDTPGGLDTSMRDIVKEIGSSNVPVIVYVSPAGARAASAGVFITLSAHVAAMAPGTNIGAAHPVAVGGGQMDDTMKEKVENDAAAYIKSIAGKRGRNIEWAENAVRKSVSITEKEALDLKVIDFIAENRDELIKKIDGREVTTNAGKVRIDTAGVVVEEFPMGMRLRILNALSDPNIAYVLMILGIYGLFFELASPGAIFPGVVGAICLILAFYAFQTLPVNYAGLLLIILGIILFIAEIKIVSYGLLSVAGVISMVLGSIMLMKVDAPFFRISWLIILPAALMTALFFAVAIGLAVKVHRRQPLSGSDGLIGEIGEAASDIATEGKVYVHGEIWDARSDEQISKGEKIRVIGTERMTVVVKKV